MTPIESLRLLIATALLAGSVDASAGRGAAFCWQCARPEIYFGGSCSAINARALSTNSLPFSPR